MTRAASLLALSLVLCPVLARAAAPSKEACIAANEAAQDLRQAGKLRDAREKLLSCVSDACPGPVREDCAQRLNDVNAAMPTIVFEVKDTSGNDVGAARVSMDGQSLLDRLTGSAVPIDPGEHHFRFDDADGRAHADQTVVVREGDHDRHVRVVLVAPGATPATSAAATPTSSAQPEATAPSNAGSAQRMIGLVVGGAGGVGLVLGSIFGLVSKGTYDRALQSECGGNKNDCSPQGAQDGQTAHGQATVSTVGFVVGGLLASGGAVLYFTAPRAGAVGVGGMVGINGTGLTVGGLW